MLRFSKQLRFIPTTRLILSNLSSIQRTSYVSSRTIRYLTTRTKDFQEYLKYLDFPKAESVLKEAHRFNESGFGESDYLGLLQGYANEGKHAKVTELIGWIRESQPGLYERLNEGEELNLMLAIACKQGQLVQEALDLASHISPNSKCVDILLQVLAKNDGEWSLVERFFQKFVDSNGMTLDETRLNLIIEACNARLEPSSLLPGPVDAVLRFVWKLWQDRLKNDAATLLEQVTTRNRLLSLLAKREFSWNLIDDETSKPTPPIYQVWQEMDDLGLTSDIATFTILMNAGINHDVPLKKALDWMSLAKNRGLTPDLVAYSTMVKIHCLERNLVEAEALIHEMKMAGIEPNAITYAVLLRTYGQTSDIGKMENLYNEVILNKKLYPDATTYAIMMKAVIQCDPQQNLTKAMQLFRDQQQFDIPLQAHSYLPLLEGYLQIGDMDSVVEAYSHFREQVEQVDSWSFTDLIRLFASYKSVGLVKRAWRDMLEDDIPLSKYTYTVLINTFGKLEQLESLKKLSLMLQMDGELQSLDMPLKNALMNAFQRCGDGTRVLQLWDQWFILPGNLPDNITISVILDTCGHHGYRNRARSIWQWCLQHQHELPLNLANYEAWMECLGRSEDYDEIMRVFQQAEEIFGSSSITKKTVGVALSFIRRSKQDERIKQAEEYFKTNYPDLVV